MREYQQKYVLRTLLYSRVTLVILFLLCILLMRSIMELNDKRMAVEKLRKDSESQRQDLEMKVEKARDKNNAITTDRGLESYIRSTYPVVKDGEGVIVVYDEASSSVADVRSTTTILEKIILYLQKFFNKS